MTKYTKGKWEIMFMSAGKNNIYVDPTMPRLIATTWDGWTSREEAEANARLISKAPEMYELLNFSLAYLRTPEAIDKELFDNRIDTLLTEIKGE